MSYRKFFSTRSEDLEPGEEDKNSTHKILKFSQKYGIFFNVYCMGPIRSRASQIKMSSI